MRDMASIGQRIRALRKAQVPPLNQMELAKAVGIDQSTISDIERGAKFNAETLMALADALHVTPAYIMRGATEDHFDEAQLVAHFRACSQDDRANLLSIAAALSARGASNPFPPSKARSK